MCQVMTNLQISAFNSNFKYKIGAYKFIPLHVYECVEHLTEDASIYIFFQIAENS